MSPEVRDKLNRHGCSSVIAYIEELERQCPPNEQGKNRFGLDVAYFRNSINRQLNRPLVDFKPSELARVFARLSQAADKSVMLEPEFIAEYQVRAFEAGAMRILTGLGSQSVEQAAAEYAKSQQAKGGE